MTSANMDVRVLMFKNGMTQKELANLMGMTQPEISMMLKREMNQSEKKRIKSVIQKAVKDARRTENA